MNLRFSGYRPSMITPQATYDSERRKLVGGMLAVAASPFVGLRSAHAAVPALTSQADHAMLKNVIPAATMPAEPLSPWRETVSHVLYHEFGEKAAPVLEKAGAMKIDPWTVVVEGEVAKPRTFGIEEILKLAPIEERIFRHRCVSGWYMVVPWNGYSLAKLLKLVEPTGQAKFVEFTSHWDDSIMGNHYYEFPYIESLRLDEAMHPLTTLTVGTYGHVLPKQNGAPVRIITPWKYAHKSPKAIVRIRLTREQPKAFFFTQYPDFYGWYRNVHPDLRQGRQQNKEKRVGEWFTRRDTPLLNGYSDQVASLYGSSLNSLR